MSSHFFMAKTQKKYKFGKIKKYDEETEYFGKKNVFIFPKGFFNKKRGRKKSRW